MNSLKPVYLIAGGTTSRSSKIAQTIEHILAQTGKEHPDVAYIGTASNDDPSFFKLIGNIIRKAGAHSVTQVKLSHTTADLKKAESMLDLADAIFISGGDVEEGMRWINHHNLVPFMKNLSNRGTVFFGISAGSIMLGRQWVRWSDPVDEKSAALFGCIGIAPVVCDTHGEVDGWEELKTAVTLMEKNGKGYGVPSGGTLVVQPDGTLVALDRPVTVYENSPGGIRESTIGV